MARVRFIEALWVEVCALSALCALRVEVCALSALSALWVEVCALSALSALWVEVCALSALSALSGRKFRYQARDHFGPALLSSRRRAFTPAFNSINLPNSQIKSESRLR
jgi:hypothetical protein